MGWEINLDGNQQCYDHSFNSNVGKVAKDIWTERVSFTMGYQSGATDCFQNVFRINALTYVLIKKLFI